MERKDFARRDPKMLGDGQTENKNAYPYPSVEYVSKGWEPLASEHTNNAKTRPETYEPTKYTRRDALQR